MRRHGNTCTLANGTCLHCVIPLLCPFTSVFQLTARYIFFSFHLEGTSIAHSKAFPCVLHFTDMSMRIYLPLFECGNKLRCDSN